MLGEILAIIAALMWATSTILATEALKKIDPVRCNGVKTFFSTLVVLPVAFAVGEINNICDVSLLGIFLVTLAAIIGIGVGDSILYKSITLIGISRAYTVAYIYPLFTMMIAVLFLSEPFQLSYLIGASLIILSVITVSTENRKDHGNVCLKGLILAGATALMWSTGINLLALGLREVSVLQANAVRYPVLSIFLFSFSQPKKRWNLDRRSLIFLLASAILGMVFGEIAFLFGIQLIGPSRATPLSASAPVWASIMSSLFLKEKATPRLLLSSLIVVIGIYFLY